jgi:PPM family protein phosphatase
MICPKCGYTAAATDRFCENCGTALSEDVPASNASGLQVCHCPPGQSKPDEDGYCQVCGIRCISEAEAARKHVEVSIDERLALVSDVGRRHPINEDTGSVARGSSDSVVMVVADGVSTAANSASASAATVEAVVAALRSLPETDGGSSSGGSPTPASPPGGALLLPADPLSDAVRSAIAAANQAVLDLPFAGGEGDGPETTVVVALCRGGRVSIGWAGDSRAYLVGPDAAEQLTVDDSWAEEAIRGGEMSRQQAMLDRRAHLVTQVLGMRDQSLDIHIVERELPEDCILLLCSDGLWNYFLESDELAATLRQHNTVDSLSECRYLVDAANERGGQDNVTVALLYIQSPKSSSPEA